MELLIEVFFKRNKRLSEFCFVAVKNAWNTNESVNQFKTGEKKYNISFFPQLIFIVLSKFCSDFFTITQKF